MPINPEIEARCSVQPGAREFSTGLFDFWKNWKVCAYGTFCFPCLYADLAEGKHARGNTWSWWEGCLVVSLCWPPISFFVTCYTRQAIRDKYGLKEKPCPDIVVHMLCPYCALCQEAREVEMGTLGRVGTRGTRGAY